MLPKPTIISVPWSDFLWMDRHFRLSKAFCYISLITLQKDNDHLICESKLFILFSFIAIVLELAPEWQWPRKPSSFLRLWKNFGFTSARSRRPAPESASSWRSTTSPSRRPTPSSRSSSGSAAESTPSCGPGTDTVGRRPSIWPTRRRNKCWRRFQSFRRAKQNVCLLVEDVKNDVSLPFVSIQLSLSFMHTDSL